MIILRSEQAKLFLESPSSPVVFSFVAWFHTFSRYRTLKSERRKEIKANEAALRLAQRKSRGATILEHADAHGRPEPRLLILYGTQVQSHNYGFLDDEFACTAVLCILMLCLPCRRAMLGRLQWRYLKRPRNEDFSRLVLIWRCTQRPGHRVV